LVFRDREGDSVGLGRVPMLYSTLRGVVIGELGIDECLPWEEPPASCMYAMPTESGVWERTPRGMRIHSSLNNRANFVPSKAVSSRAHWPFRLPRSFTLRAPPRAQLRPPQLRPPFLPTSNTTPVSPGAALASDTTPVYRHPAASPPSSFTRPCKRLRQMRPLSVLPNPAAACPSFTRCRRSPPLNQLRPPRAAQRRAPPASAAGSATPPASHRAGHGWGRAHGDAAPVEN
jgi:hypothetical protein